MEHLLRLLELSDVHTFEELNNAFFCDLNRDKVLIIKEITSLQEIEEMVYTLPRLKEKLQKTIINAQNVAEVEDLNLSKFLWDMYVIGIHHVTNEEDKFNDVDVAKIQRNRFVARKIIIEYVTEEDLKVQFDQLVLPERALNQLLKEYVSKEAEYQPEQIEELLKQIEDILR